MATKSNVQIVINPPNFQQVKLKVTGLTPLIQNKMKETTVIFDQLRNQSYNDFLHPKLTDWLNTI